MEKLAKVLGLLIPIVLALGIGWFCRKKKIFTNDTADGMKTLIIKFCLPFVVFGAFYNATFDVNILICSAVVIVTMLLGLFLGSLLEKFLRGKLPLLRFVTCGFEAGMIAIPLYTLLFGQENLPTLFLLHLGHEIFIFTVYVTLLNSLRNKGRKDSIIGALQNPILWGMILGIIFGVTGLGKLLGETIVGSIIDSTVEFISKPVSCLILIVIGYQMELSANSIRGALPYVLTRFFAMALLGALTYILVGLFIDITPMLKWAIAIMFITPAPFILPLYVQQPKKAAEVSTALSIYTLLTVLMFAVVVALSA